MNTERSVDILYSLAGLTPWTIRPKDLRNACEWVKEADMRFAVIASRAFAGPEGKQILQEYSVGMLTRPWNPHDNTKIPALAVGIWNQLHGRTPNINDASFYPKKKEAADVFSWLVDTFPQALISEWNINEFPIPGVDPKRFVIEVTPEHFRSVGEAVDLCQERGYGIEIDPRHTFGDWEKALEVFKRSGLPIVFDVAGKRSDAQELLKGQGFLPEAIKAAREVKTVIAFNCQIPIHHLLTPKDLLQKNPVKSGLTDIANAIKEAKS